MNISIFASIGAHNLGDELILKNEIKLLEQEFSGKNNFRVFSYDIKNPFFVAPNISYLEYFPIDSKKPKNLFRNIKNTLRFFSTLLWSDIVVIGWGGIIYDSEIQSNRNPLDQWLFRTNIAKKLRKKIYFYVVGIDIQQEENKNKLRDIFSWAWKITVRDSKSFFTLKELWIHSEVVLDPVYSDRDGFLPQGRSLLQSYSSRNFSLRDLQKYDFEGKRVGIALRSWYIGKSKQEKIEKLIVAEVLNYIEQQGWQIVFLPHSFHQKDMKSNDFLFLEQFLTETQEIKKSMQEVYEVYVRKEVDINIAMRLHSIILSEVYEIPYIALSYSQKTEEQLKKLSQ